MNHSANSETNNLQKECNLKIISNKNNYPKKLTDCFGDWIDDEFYPNNLQEYNAIAELKYRSGVDDFEFNEESLFYCSVNETSFLAYHDHKIGVLVEIELDIGKLLEHQNGDSEVLGGTKYLPATKFNLAIEHWASKLTNLRNKYLNSDLFLAHGAPISDDRLAVCAFTPINFDALHEKCETDKLDIIYFKSLDESLNDLVYN